MGMECGGLNENVLHRFKYLNTWFPIGGAVWRGLRGVALVSGVSLAAGLEVSND